jgi:peptidyl-prolyl cis-trans isomerase C
MPKTAPLAVGAAVILALACAAQAQPAPAPADQEILRNADTTLTRADWEADLLRIPADQRAAFVTGPQRVQSAVNSLLVAKTLAARARQKGWQEDPLVQRRMALEADRVLAAAMLDRIEADALAEFDRRPDQNKARARELYLLEAQKYAAPEQVAASHILFKTETRTPEAALAAAQDARAKLVVGADFAAIARELSDDPTAKRNSGRLGSFARGRMDPAFEQVAFAQTTVGEISEPVLSSFGYHLIRHEGRTAAKQIPFADVEAKILSDMRQAHGQKAREDVINDIRADPKMVVNQPALESLVVTIPLPPQTRPAAGAKRGS